MSISATERAKSLETMLALSLVCLALYSVGGSRFLVLPAIFLLSIGLFAKRFAVLLSDLWLRFAHAIGMVNSRILITLLFFLVLTPVAWFYRLGHRNMLQLRRAPSASSYFFELNRTVSRDDFGKMW